MGITQPPPTLTNPHTQTDDYVCVDCVHSKYYACIYTERERENIHKKEKEIGHDRGRGKDRASSIPAIIECNTTNTKQKRRGESRRREGEREEELLSNQSNPCVLVFYL